MSVLEPLIKAIRAPLDLIRSKVFGVQSIKGGMSGDVKRLKDVGAQYKDAAKGAVGAGQKANAAAQQAGTVKTPQIKKRKKMGLFSKSKKCPNCGAKMHPSWDQCPECGAGGQAAAAPAPSGGGGKARTMALDLGAAGAGGANNIGWLVPLDGLQAGELFELKKRCTVGSAPDCDVILKDPSISGRHAEFIPAANGFRINDLGSTNGTFVNDKRVSQQDLIDNDNVRLGRTNFKFKSMN
jgi:hypothetical protein